MARALSAIHVPAAGTRFFIMLPEVLDGNIIKRAQTNSSIRAKRKTILTFENFKKWTK
jgi:hypothetical protein